METTPRMTFFEALLKVFNVKRNYSYYRGRARRSEFWYTTLVCIVMLAIIDGFGYMAEQKLGYNSNTRIILDIASAYFLIVNYSCLCRRMHDIGRSNFFPGLALSFAVASLACFIFWQHPVTETICYILFAVTILLLAYTLFLCTKDSDRGKNRYGYSEKYVDPADNPEVMEKFWKDYGNDIIKKKN